MGMLNGIVGIFVVSLLAMSAAGSGLGSVAAAHAAVVDVGGGNAVTHAAEFDDGALTLQAAARTIRTATAVEAERFGALALASSELGLAQVRLSPLEIDSGQPRFVGSSVGLIGVYYPIRGAREGQTSQYALWFYADTGAVWAEAEFLQMEEGVHVRMVIEGEEVINLMVDGDGPPSPGNFWECFRWCLGESLSSQAYAVFRAVCGRLCFPVPGFFCDKCMIALGLLEAGMISGCTYECSKNP